MVRPDLRAGLGFAATLGTWPAARWAEIVRAIGFVFAIAAASASIAFGITRGFSLEMPDMLGPVYSQLSQPQRLRFTQTLAMHETSYDAAAIATLVAAGWIVWRRRTSFSPAPPP